MTSAAPTVSVLIPTYNRSAYLCRTLRQLLAQSYPDFEVIVIDQDSHHPPETECYLESIRHRIRYHKLGEPSVTRAKNLALSKANGEVIVSIDDDIDLPDDLIWRHVRNYEDPDICAVAGRIVDERSGKRDIPDKCGVIDWHGRVIGNFHAKSRALVDHGRGANISYLREIALRSGGFDERFTGSAVREETDFCIRYLKADPRRMVFDPDTTVFHHVAPTGGCRIESKPLEPLSYAHEFYFWLKNFPLWMLPYWIPNLFVRFVLTRRHVRRLDDWREIPRRIRAMIRGISIGLALYFDYRRKSA